jgi:hypothetical protein
LSGRHPVVRIQPASAYVEIEGAGALELADDDDQVFVSGNGSVTT